LKHVNDIVKDCIDGIDDAGETTKFGERYCTKLISTYRIVCPHMQREKIFISIPYGNHSIDRYYNKCSRGDDK